MTGYALLVYGTLLAIVVGALSWRWHHRRMLQSRAHLMQLRRVVGGLRRTVLPGDDGADLGTGAGMRVGYAVHRVDGGYVHDVGVWFGRHPVSAGVQRHLLCFLAAAFGRRAHELEVSVCRGNGGLLFRTPDADMGLSASATIEELDIRARAMADHLRAHGRYPTTPGYLHLLRRVL